MIGGRAYSYERGRSVVPVPYTVLVQCQSCGRIGPPKRVQYRSLLDLVLCMGCWNRIRAIKKRRDEIAALTKELRRETSNYRRTARSAVCGD